MVCMMMDVTHRVRLLTCFALLLMVLLVVSGCSAAPPDIVEADIVGFALEGIWSETIGREGLPEPDRPLDRLVAAYNAADGARWRVDTTPSLFVSIDLIGGMRLSLQFSSQYPEDGVLVLAWDGESDEATEHHIDSPDLLPAVWELLSDEQRQSLKASEQRPWLPE